MKELLRIAGELGFRVMLTTNGTLLPEKREILLCSPALHKVNLSLQSFEANDAGELEPYLAACRASGIGQNLEEIMLHYEKEDYHEKLA